MNLSATRYWINTLNHFGKLLWNIVPNGWRESSGCLSRVTIVRPNAITSAGFAFVCLSFFLNFWYCPSLQVSIGCPHCSYWPKKNQKKREKYRPGCTLSILSVCSFINCLMQLMANRPGEPELRVPLESFLITVWTLWLLWYEVHSQLDLLQFSMWKKM